MAKGIVTLVKKMCTGSSLDKFNIVIANGIFLVILTSSRNLESLQYHFVYSTALYTHITLELP